jgi:hypothetical protein
MSEICFAAKKKKPGAREGHRAFLSVDERRFIDVMQKL